MVVSRLLIALVGALPATVLGSFAIGVVYGGIRMLATAEPGGLLLATWGLLGIIGVAGLWLAAISGPGSIVASLLIGCGLAAEAVLVYLAITNAASAASFRLHCLEAAYAVLLTLPFLVGAAYIWHALVRERRTSGDGQAV
jgi:hypothetical protein